MLEGILIFLVIGMFVMVVLEYKGWRPGRKLTGSLINANTHSFCCKIDYIKDHNNEQTGIFEVMIRGELASENAGKKAILQLLVADVTRSRKNAEAVLWSPDHRQAEGTGNFCFHCDLGKISRDSYLSQWTSVAKIDSRWLWLPRQGRRKLLFVTSVICAEDNKEAGSANCFIEYDNNEFGYIDLTDNHDKVQILSLQLAATVKGKKTEAIKEWIDKKTAAAEDKKSKKLIRKRLKQALKELNSAHRNAGMRDLGSICKEMAARATVAERYEAVDLWLRAAIEFAKDPTEDMIRIAELLALDSGRVREMMQKALPVSVYEDTDTDILLGIASDMTADQTRQQLNDEYRKWNARVTHPDKEVQAKASEMLELIAQSRNS